MSDMTTDQKPERRYLTLPILHRVPVSQVSPELDRLVELLPRIERWVATEPSQPASEILAELEATTPQVAEPLTVEEARAKEVCRYCGKPASEEEKIYEPKQAHAGCLREQAIERLAKIDIDRGQAAARKPLTIEEMLRLMAKDAVEETRNPTPPDPGEVEPLTIEEKYPLTVEQASGRRVCRICGMSPVEQTLDGEGDVLECAHPDCLDREQAAAADRKEPASETRPVRVFRVNGRREGELIAVEKIGDRWTFGPESSWGFSDDSVLAKLATGEWTEITGSTAEPSAESEPQLTDWDRSELGIKAIHKAYAILGSGYEELEQQFATTQKEADELRRASWRESERFNNGDNEAIKRLEAEVERLKKIIATNDSLTKIYAIAQERDDLKQQLAAAQALLKTEKYEHSHTLSQRDKAQAEALKQAADAGKLEFQLRAWREAADLGYRYAVGNPITGDERKRFVAAVEALRAGSLPNKT